MDQFEILRGTGDSPYASLDDLQKALGAGYGTSPATQTGGGALRVEALGQAVQPTTHPPPPNPFS